MKLFRRATGILIAAVLLVTAQSMAFARGQAPAENQIVLCTGHGIVMVYVDADGRPTSAPELCADGFALFAALDVPDFVEPTHTAQFQRFSRLHTTKLVSLFHVRRSARSPPIV